MPFDPTEFLHEWPTSSSKERKTIPWPRWLRVNEHNCSFWPDHFLEAALNLIKNPNVNSSNLFRADIFYDSQSNELTNADVPGDAPTNPLEWMADDYGAITGFVNKRRIVRQLIPRNPQLDRPVDQTCMIFERAEDGNIKEIIMILLPHVTEADDLPWYHPSVQAIAYWYETQNCGPSTHPDTHGQNTNKVSIHYQLFPTQKLPLDKRLLRTGRNLLQTIYKHGTGRNVGYQKQGHHDQIISQKRVQDTYTELKAKHAKRLCDAWVEKTEPSKHVYEDLGIAAYLIELWKDMYAPPGQLATKDRSSLPEFPGFVDIGCGNGVLTEVLILSGYHGRGYDARRRKTWSILSPKAQPNLHEMLCVPQPLFDLYPPTAPSPKPSLLARTRALFHKVEHRSSSSLIPPKHPWHNGLPSPGTFIISNHADELTPWTPLLACLSASPFLAIPCCSHNLSGARFRAPTAFNAYSADAAAPGYFAAQKKPMAKSIPITIPMQHNDEEHEHTNVGEDTNEQMVTSTKKLPETGNLRALAPANRAKQPSAYASLCDWVAHLSHEAGYVVERDMLRIPSTRNIGLVGRMWAADVIGTAERTVGMNEADITEATQNMPVAGYEDSLSAQAARHDRVRRILLEEGTDGFAWVQRCNEILAKGGGVIPGRE